MVKTAPHTTSAPERAAEGSRSSPAPLDRLVPTPVTGTLLVAPSMPSSAVLPRLPVAHLRRHFLGQVSHYQGNQAVQDLIARSEQRSAPHLRLIERAEAAESEDAKPLTASFWASNDRLQMAARNAPPLKAGDSDPAVALLQEALAKQGFAMPGSTKPDGTFDGVWGGETTTTVRAFQTEAGVRPVGGWEAGKKTLGALDARLQDGPAPVPPGPLPIPPGPLPVPPDPVPPEPVPTGEKDGIGDVSEIPVLASGEPRSGLILGFVVGGGPDDAMEIPYQGSVQQSVYVVARWMTNGDERKAAAVAAKVVLTDAAYNIPAGKRPNKDAKTLPTLDEFDAYCRSEKKVVLLPQRAQLLLSELGVTRDDVTKAVDAQKKFGDVLDKADRMRQFGDINLPLNPAEAKEQSRRAGKKRTAFTGDAAARLKELGNPQFAQVYVNLLPRYSSPPIPGDQLKKMAEDGLTPDEVDSIIAKDDKRQLITDYFTQVIIEARAAGANMGAQLFTLEETLLDQLAWGNPTAVENQLMVGVGKPEQELGLVHRPDGFLYYFANGHPVTAFAGGGPRDPGFRGVSKDARTALINISAIPDPALRDFFLHLQSRLGEPTQVMVAGVESLIDNYEEVTNRIVNGLDKELLEQIEDAIKFLAMFLVVRGATMALKRSQNVWLQGLGWAIDGATRVAMFMLDIEFLGSLEQILMSCGFELVRVKPRDNKSAPYDSASQHHLEQAAGMLRPVIAQIIVVLLQKGLEGKSTPEAKKKSRQKAKETLDQITKNKKRAGMKCNTCEIVWHAAEFSKEVSKERFCEPEVERRKKAGIKVKPGEVLRSDRHPNVEFHPDGNVFGPYQDVLAVYQEHGLTGHKNPDVSFESHHLMEENQMKLFNVEMDEGRCVGLERRDHQTFSSWMRGILNREAKMDIDEVFFQHQEMYTDNGHPEYVPQMRRFLMEFRGRIEAAYRDGTVPTAKEENFSARRARVRDWFAKGCPSQRP